MTNDNRNGCTTKGPINWGLVLTADNSVRCATFKNRRIPKLICMLRQTHARCLEMRSEMRSHVRRCVECPIGAAVAAEQETTMGNKGICIDCNGPADIKCRGLCRKHYNYRHHHGTLPEKPEKQKPVGVVLTSSKKDEPVVVRLGPGLMLTIDFTQYPDIFEALKNRARDEIRPIEYQALFSIRDGLGIVGPDIKAVVDAIIREAKIESATVRCA
jgi:hypothetical protein